MNSLQTTILPSVIVVSPSFPTAAIVVLAVGAYIIFFTISLLIRKCIITKGQSFCPTWFNEICTCQTCCVNNSVEETGCLISFARACDFPLPHKQVCMECLPTKQWCDNTFCSCLNGQSNECSGCKNTNFGEFTGCEDCKECSEFCGNCDCNFCSQPDSINCCCIEIKLTGNRAQNPGHQMNPYGGYSSNQMYYNNQGNIINQQPSLMTTGNHPVRGDALFNTQQAAQFQNTSYNPNQSFSAGYQSANSRLLPQPREQLVPGQQAFQGQQSFRGQQSVPSKMLGESSNSATIRL
ncbi:uncharacterized protein LOC100211777 [Hydra vulgaris]|uniref:uncharacterized protein LOC100211777 n=1 Tax=Hydra vulgaris TaxID=6087 RepID=UPI0001926FCF|nr:uncharacterized protein LOC100211777 [Hydra vulgaris]